MKKLFTLFALFASSLAASAIDYTDKLTVTINGVPTPAADYVISVDEQSDGRYTLTLKNFEMSTDGGSLMSVGTITVTDVEAVALNEGSLLKATQEIEITEGDQEPASGMWMGPNLSPVPVDVTAEMTAGHLYAMIKISFMGLNIEVTFGDVYQLGNAGFELFHTVKANDPFTQQEVTSDEPNNWHSFMSCTGSLASFVSGTPHTFTSNEIRPGSTGKKSVLIKSGLVLNSIVANGTLTTGRLMAGAMSATDPKNNAFVDITSTDVDANGDPFYTLLSGKPDSIGVWVRFKQETPVAEHPYATMTAVITDGSYYQEPVDKDYTDIIVAKAACNTIESKDFAWQRLSLPFDYDSYTDKDAKAILITLSTNADPGEGTGNDELYVDDIELIYNCSVTGISVKGTPIADFEKDKTEYNVTIDGDNADVQTDEIQVTTDAKDAVVMVTKVDVDGIGGGSDVTITVMSKDLKKSSCYVVHTRGNNAMGINRVSNGADGNASKSVYNLNGQRVNDAKCGNVYITKSADGKTVKAISK